MLITNQYKSSTPQPITKTSSLIYHKKSTFIKEISYFKQDSQNFCFTDRSISSLGDKNNQKNNEKNNGFQFIINILMKIKFIIVNLTNFFHYQSIGLNIFENKSNVIKLDFSDKYKGYFLKLFIYLKLKIRI